MTIEQYDVILETQGHRCLICHRPESENNRSLHVDHDPVTLKARGLICSKCNRILGGLYQDPATLLAMVDYISTSGIANMISEIAPEATYMRDYTHTVRTRRP